MSEEATIIPFQKTKTCPKCKHEKPLTAFYKHHEFGTQGYCKNCTRKDQHARYRTKNPVQRKFIPDHVTQTKVCTKCLIEKSFDEFYVDRKRNAPEPYCKICVLAARKERTKRRIEHFANYQRDSDLRKKYGMSIADYEMMLIAQGGKCKLCHTTHAGRKYFLVDHDHATGKVRGLLCSKCNAGLGMFNDDVMLLRLALLYIENGGSL